MIKPNVLTHVIEGFVIQEANEPFAVTRHRYSDENNDEPPSEFFFFTHCALSIYKNRKAKLFPFPLLTEKRLALTDSTTDDRTSDMASCESCGKLEPKGKLKKKPYCSTQCATKALNKSHLNIDEPMVVDKMDEKKSIVIGQPNEMGKTVSASGDNATGKAESNQASGENGITTTAIVEAAEPMPMISKWTVSDVCEFIKTLPGCSDYVEDFDNQEIDGQALLLLKESHLVSAMGMKLGPALKIVAKVESMKDSSLQEQ